MNSNYIPTVASDVPDVHVRVASSWNWVQLHPWATILGLLLVNVTVVKYRKGLRSIPGPFLASFSNLWKFRAVWNQNMHLENIRVHEQYGSIVRIGPNHVSLSDPQSMRTIYGIQNVFPKVRYTHIVSLSPLICPSTHESTEECPD